MSSSPQHIAFTLDFSPLVKDVSAISTVPSSTHVSRSGSPAYQATGSFLSGEEKTFIYDQINHLVDTATVQIKQNCLFPSTPLDVIPQASLEILTNPQDYFWRRASYDANRVSLLLVPNVAKIKERLRLPFQQFLTQKGKFPFYLRLWFVLSKLLGIQGVRAKYLTILFDQRFDEFATETTKCLMSGWNELFFDTYRGSVNHISPVFFSTSSNNYLRFSLKINDREVIFNYA